MIGKILNKVALFKDKIVLNCDGKEEAYLQLVHDWYKTVSVFSVMWIKVPKYHNTIFGMH